MNAFCLTRYKLTVESLGMFHVSLADGKEGVASFKQMRSPEFTSVASRMPDFYPWWR